MLNVLFLVQSPDLTHIYVRHVATTSLPDTVQIKKIKNLKQSWLTAFWRKVQNTQAIKRTLFN